jgi:hypothetical protein
MLVELFFIISGFLFAYVYIPRIRKKEYTFDKFIFKRFTRIMPIVILTSSICYILIFIMETNNINCWTSFCGNKRDIVSLLFDFLFSGIMVIDNKMSLNGPIWYTNVLLVCYALAYVLTRIYIRFSNKSIFLFPIMLGIIIFVKGWDWQKPLLTFGTARGYIAFFEGIILHFFINKIDMLEKRTKKILIFISLFIFVISFRFLFLHFEDYSVYVSNVFIFFDFIVYPPLIYILYNFKLLNNFCSTKFIKNLGKISYGIYLWNYPILGGVYLLIKFLKVSNETIIKYYFLIWMIIVILHFILSILSYNFVEKKFYYKKN